MKKILTVSALLGSLIIFAPSQPAKAAEAGFSGAAAASNAAAQWQDRQWRNRRGARIVNRTRVVRRGFAVYREVVQYRYRPNGSVTARVISRTRIR